VRVDVENVSNGSAVEAKKKVKAARRAGWGVIGAGVRRILVTAVECASADGRFLSPLTVGPTTTHRNTWTTHPTPR